MNIMLISLMRFFKFGVICIAMLLLDLSVEFMDFNSYSLLKITDDAIAGPRIGAGRRTIRRPARRTARRVAHRTTRRHVAAGVPIGIAATATRLYYLPPDCVEVMRYGILHYLCQGTYYREVVEDGQIVYIVVD